MPNYWRYHSSAWGYRYHTKASAIRVLLRPLSNFA